MVIESEEVLDIVTILVLVTVHHHIVVANYLPFPNDKVVITI